MQATLLYTDNEKVEDLVNTRDTLMQIEGDIYEFADINFISKEKTDIGNGKLQFVSTRGYTYLFKI
jgi:hypothetical protein